MALPNSTTARRQATQAIIDQIGTRTKPFPAPKIIQKSNPQTSTRK